MNRKFVVRLLAFVSLSAVSLFGSAAYAQDTPKFDVFAGYSYVRENPSTSGVDGFNLHGGSASIAYNANHWLSGVADFGGYHSNNILGTGVDGTLSTYLFGPRISYHRDSRITPFGQVLFGVAHIGGSNGLYALQRIRHGCANSEQLARLHRCRVPLLIATVNCS